jgi:DNA repair protein RecN (Recombination protein N)
MLSRLYISNFALIQEMDVSFPGGLTVITGETGAGKSIFLEALGLALGKRADMAALKNKAKKCIIEAEFDVSELDLSSFFEENDLQAEKQIVLRREINADGKSRSFLNDSVINLQGLKVLSEKLIDIHSQHQTLLLNQGNFQLEILDAFAASSELYKTYKNEFAKHDKLCAQLTQVKAQEQQARKELDYFQFLFNELDEAAISKGQLAELEEESFTLQNAETIRTNLTRAASVINEGEVNILSQLSAVKQDIQAIAKYSTAYQTLSERIIAVNIELKDLSLELASVAEGITSDDKRLDEINSRLDRINRLLKKHNVKSEDELLLIKQDVEVKLLQFSSLESEIQKTEKEIAKVKSACVEIANKLSVMRRKATENLEKQVKEILSGLSMENAVFKIELNKLEELSGSGLDQIKFTFSANKGVAPSELNKVASGGELSRLMLTLKALLAEKKKLPTIIFDEIDTGVSGDVADKIGNILSLMGRKLQVITITHLAQMASKGKHHLFVYKKDNDDQTVSYIRELNREERITEIAKMLSTSTPSASALKNAKELLSA